MSARRLARRGQRLAAMCLVGLIAWQAVAASVASALDLRALPFEQRRHYALIVGIGDYEHLPDLKYADDDARLLHDRFEALGYVSEPLIDSTPRSRDISAADVLGQLERYATELAALPAAERGNLVFVFAGHGFQRGKQNYLALSGTRAFDLPGTALALEDIKERLVELEVERRVLFIDACRDSGARVAAEADPTFARDYSATEGLSILYSTGADDYAYEYPELGAGDERGHGAFSYFLAEALSGRATRDEHGFLLFDDIAAHVVERVVAYTAEHGADGATQRPYRAGESSGRFVLGRVAPEAGEPLDTAPPEDGTGRSGGLGGVAALGTIVGLLTLGALLAGRRDDGADEPTGAGTIRIPLP